MKVAKHFLENRLDQMLRDRSGVAAIEFGIFMPVGCELLFFT